MIHRPRRMSISGIFSARESGKPQLQDPSVGTVFCSFKHILHCNPSNVFFLPTIPSFPPSFLRSLTPQMEVIAHGSGSLLHVKLPEHSAVIGI